MNDEFFPIRKLTHGDPTDRFDCTQHALNHYLRQHAQKNQEAGLAQTYVIFSGSELIGFYSMCASSIAFGAAPKNLTDGVPRFPIPAILLARMAVDRRFQGRNVGKALMKDMFLKALGIADVIGVRAIMVHAKDEAVGFYGHFNFKPAPNATEDAAHTLFISLKDVESILSRQNL